MSSNELEKLVHEYLELVMSAGETDDPSTAIAADKRLNEIEPQLDAIHMDITTVLGAAIDFFVARETDFNQYLKDKYGLEEEEAGSAC